MSLRANLFTTRKRTPGVVPVLFCARFQDGFAVFTLLNEVVRMNEDRFRKLYKKVERVYN